jgi:cysteinyl-tRNA synthetase
MYRGKVESLMNYLKVLLVAHNQSQGGRGVAFSRKATPESRTLFTSLQVARVAVQQALSDDFDTPRALKLLGDLVSDAARYSMRTLEALDASEPVADRVLHPVEPLMSTAQYVMQTLTLFGLKFPAAFNLNRMLTTPVINRRRSLEGDAVTPCEYSDMEGGGLVSSDAIDSVLEFRSAVRQSGVTGLKQLKQQRKNMAAGDTSSSSFDGMYELDAHLQSLLRQCDEARSRLESSLGIKIDDIAGDKSKWRRVK